MPLKFHNMLLVCPWRHAGVNVASFRFLTSKGLYIGPYIGSYFGFRVLFSCPIWLPHWIVIPTPCCYSLCGCLSFPASIHHSLRLLRILCSVFTNSLRLLRTHYSQFGWLKFFNISCNVQVFMPSFVQRHMFSLRPRFGKLLSRPGAGPPAP